MWGGGGGGGTTPVSISLSFCMIHGFVYGVVTVFYHHRGQASFPAVTVCNLNKLAKSKLGGSRFTDLGTLDNEYLGGTGLSSVSVDPGKRAIYRLGGFHHIDFYVNSLYLLPKF